MARHSIELDDPLVGEALRRFPGSSPSEVVDLALRRLVAEPAGREFLLSLEGSCPGVAAVSEAPQPETTSAPVRGGRQE